MKKKLLITTTTFPAKAGDGSPEFVLTLARALTESFDVTVLAPRVKGGRKNENIDGVTVRRFAYFVRPFEGVAEGAILPNIKADPWRIIEAPFLSLFMLIHTMRMSRNADVINPHWILPGGICAYIAKWITKKPYVVTVHGADAYALEGKAGRALKRLVLRSASSTLPVSTDIADRLGVPQSNVVPMGVDVEAISAKVGTRTPEPNSLLFIGRLADKKGVDVLLNALSKSDASLIVAGDGPERNDLEQLSSKLGLSNRVQFLGTQTAEQVCGLLKTATAVVIPSRISKNGDREGTPVVLSEAMAAGIPVIASNFGGMSEHIVDGKTGLLVEPESVDELQKAIERICSDTALTSELASNAKTAMIGALDLRSVASKYTQHIEAAAK